MAIRDLSIKVNLDLSESEKELKEVIREIEALGKKKVELQIKYDSLEEIKKELKEIEGLIETLTKKKVKLEIETSSTEEIKNELKEIYAMLEELQGKKHAINLEAEDIENTGILIREIDEELQALSDKRAMLQIETEDLELANEAIVELAETLEAVTDRKATINVDGQDLQLAKENIIELSETVSTLESKGVRIDVDTSGLKEADSKLSYIDDKIRSLSDLLVVGAGIKALDWGIKSIGKQMTNAVDRYDTLNNFPRVMEYMGYTAEEAAGSMEKMLDSILGLPTGLDFMVKNTQDLAIAFGDLDLATDVMTAINASLLIQNGNMQDVNSGTRQWLSVLQRGEPTWQQWVALNRYSSFALEDVAKQMGYYIEGTEGGAEATAGLYDAIRDGEVSMKDVARTLAELEQQTGKFSEGARLATDGVRTGFTNMYLAFTRGLTEIISAIDNTLSAFGGISGVLSSVGDVVEKVLKGIAGVINYFDSAIVGVIASIAGFKLALIGIKKVLLGFAGLKVVLSKIPLIGGLFGGGGVSKDPNKWLKQLQGLSVLAAGAGTIILFANAVDQMNKKVPNNLGELLPKIATLGIVATGIFGFAKLAGTIVNPAIVMKGTASIALASASLFLMLELIEQIDQRLPNDGFWALQAKIGTFALVATELYLLVAAGGILAPLAIGAIIGAGAIVAASASLMMMIETIKRIDQELPNDMGSLKKKIKSLNEVIDLLVKKNPLKEFGNLIATTFNLVTTAMIARTVELYIAMIAMFETINNADIDYNQTKSDMRDMNEIMDILSADDGIFASWRKMKATEYDTKTTFIIKEMVSALVEITRDLRAIEDKNVDFDDAKKNIAEINAIVESMTTDKGVFASRNQSIAQGYDADRVTAIHNIIETYVNIAEKLKDLNNIEEINYSDALKNIKDIDKVVQFLTVEEGRINRWWKSKAMEYQEDIVESVKSIITMYGDIAKQLERIVGFSGNLDYDDARGVIEAIDEVVMELITEEKKGELEKLRGAQEEFGEIISIIKETITSYTEIAKLLEELSKFKSTDIIVGNLNIRNINGAVNELRTNVEDIITFDQVTSQTNLVEVTKSIKEMIDEYVNIANALMGLSEISSADIYEQEQKIKRIDKDVIQFLITQESKRKTGNQSKAQENVLETVKSIQEIIHAYIEIGHTLLSLEDEFGTKDDIFDNAKKIANQIIDATDEIANVAGNWWDSVVGKWESSNEAKMVANASSIVNSYLLIGRDLEKIGELKIGGVELAIKTKLKYINECLEKIAEREWANGDFTEAFNTALGEALSACKRYVELGEELISIGNQEINKKEIEGKIKDVEEVITRMLNLQIEPYTDVSGLHLATKIVEEIQSLIEQLKALDPGFEAIGRESFADAIYRGFNEYKLPKQILDIIDEVLKKLKDKDKDFEKRGETFGKKLAKAFKDAVKDMHKEVDVELKALNSKAGAFEIAGTSLGNALRVGFVNAVQGMASAVNTQLSAINTAPTITPRKQIVEVREVLEVV